LCRIIALMIFFLSYIGGMVYFNYYYRAADGKVVEMFNAFNSLSTYISSTGTFLKEGIKTEDKTIISYGNLKLKL